MSTAPNPTLEAEEVWLFSEKTVIESVDSLTRWDAERWAAGHERRLPPIRLAGLQASLMQVAINAERDQYLDSAFKRIERAVTKQPWSDHRIVEGEATQAVKETKAAVVRLAQYALAAEVLSDVVDRLSPHRQQQLHLAKETVGCERHKGAPR
ncbi:MAG: hypothetical protein GY724_04060 [Actinomycetia bacterium]|nr:hypothetical protein [Actinomycetes bacterium]MCP5033124.1 hypothetical protein [Actinomycetes bacterium]